jgi:SAM-dependent methyltransferase
LEVQDRLIDELRAKLDSAVERHDEALSEQDRNIRRHEDIVARHDMVLERYCATVDVLAPGFEDVENRVAYARYAIDVLEAQLSAQIEELRRGLGGPLSGTEAVGNQGDGSGTRASVPEDTVATVAPAATGADGAASPAAFSELGAAFESRFRGSRALITERLAEYLPDVRSLEDPGPAVDLGCGRGEWLALMAAEGIEAHGIELDPRHVAECRRIGLDVREEDLIGHLKGLDDDSMGMVTAFHVAEHLPIDVLVALVDQCARILRPGGLVILETPNPDNVLVGASSFYLDPTHLRPLPPALLEFVVGSRGFVDIETRRLTRREAGPLIPQPEVDEPSSLVLGPVVELLNSRMLEGQDVAVLARVPPVDARR